jgi:hypothetical protein
VSPLPVGGGQDCAAAVHDRRKPVGKSGASIAKLDLMQAIVTGERHANVSTR